MRKHLIIGISAVIAITVLITNNAHAASEYDNVINKTDKLLLENDVSNKNLDITQSYLENLRQCSQSEYDNLMTVINNSGSWAISIYNTNGHPTWDGSKNIVAIYWASTIRPDYTPKITFGPNSNEAGGKAAFADYDHSATLRLKSNDLLDCQAGGTDPIANGYWRSPISTEIQNQAGSTKVFLATYPVEYPENYEGQTIPNTWTPPITPTTWLPKIRYDYNGSTWIRAMDTDLNLCIPFNPDDVSGDVLAEGAIREECADRTRVLIKYQLKDESGNVVNELSTRADLDYEYNEIQLGQKYTLKATYEYESQPIPNADGSPSTIYTPRLDDNQILGSSEIIIDTTKGPVSGLSDGSDCAISGNVRTCTAGGLGECFKTEAPYVDIPKCMDNVNQVIRTLSFGTISFIKVPTGSECRTLGTLGDWINVVGQNRVLCPQVPAAIRNIITPFVTVALGMLLVVLISKLGRGDDKK